jgi:flagellar biosynthesis protein FliQ
MDWMPQAIREGIFTIIFISGPLVILAATLGLSVGIIQAATQIQEQTLASAVKIIGLFLALIVFGFYMFQYLKQYTAENLERAFRLVPSLGSYVKPRDNFLSHKEDDATGVSGVDAPGLSSGIEPESSAGRLSDSLNEPDMTNVNIGKEVDSLGQPKGQIREPDENIKRIDDRLREATPRTDNAQEENPVTNSPRVIDEPVVRSAPARRPPEPTVTPQPRPRKSLTGALDRIRSNLEE